MRKKDFDPVLFKERLFKVLGEDTQADLAGKIGVSPPTVSKWLNGDSAPPINDLLNISREYNVSIDYLVGNDNNAKDHLSTRQICEMLIAIDDALPDAHIRTSKSYDFLTDEDDQIVYDNNNCPIRECNGEMHLSMSYFFDTGRIYYEDGMNISDIVDFFDGYTKLKSLPSMPEHLAQSAIRSWLDALDKKQSTRDRSAQESMNNCADIDEELPFH